MTIRRGSLTAGAISGTTVLLASAASHAWSATHALRPVNDGDCTAAPAQRAGQVIAPMKAE